MEKHELFSLKKTEEKQLLLIMKFFFTFFTDRNKSLSGNKFVFTKQTIHNENLAKDGKASLPGD